MFDVSWTELFLVAGVGLFLVGKKDLPRVANTFGSQVGRVVGFLQGARARADRFAEHSELRQLQNELRSGLRELDAVKSELAVSLSPGSMMGRNLGAMTASANRPTPLAPAPHLMMTPPGARPQMMITPAVAAGVGTGVASALSGEVDPSNETPPILLQQPQQDQPFNTPATITSSVYQTTAAVAEQEWAKQGISFQSAAERGAGLSPNYNLEQSGSAMLSNFIQQSLIFDQYDRTVAEQDAALQNKMESIIQSKQEEKRRKDEEKQQ